MNQMRWALMLWIFCRGQKSGRFIANGLLDLCSEKKNFFFGSEFLMAPSLPGQEYFCDIISLGVWN